jgi:hypothetical protein
VIKHETNLLQKKDETNSYYENVMLNFSESRITRLRDEPNQFAELNNAFGGNPAFFKTKL